MNMKRSLFKPFFSVLSLASAVLLLSCDGTDPLYERLNLAFSSTPVCQSQQQLATFRNTSDKETVIGGARIAGGSDPEGNFFLNSLLIDGEEKPANADGQIYEQTIPAGATYSFKITYKPKKENAGNMAVLDVVYYEPQQGLVQVEVTGRASTKLNCPDIGDPAGGIEDDECTSDVDCAIGEVCQDGVCEVSDDGDGECAPACTADQVCQGGACVPISTGGECTPQCTNGQVCRSGMCVTPAPTGCNPACTGGQVCQNNVCVTPAPTGCNPACANGQVCQDNACVTPTPSLTDPFHGDVQIQVNKIVLLTSAALPAITTEKVKEAFTQPSLPLKIDASKTGGNIIIKAIPRGAFILPPSSDEKLSAYIPKETYLTMAQDALGDYFKKSATARDVTVFMKINLKEDSPGNSFFADYNVELTTKSAAIKGMDAAKLENNGFTVSDGKIFGSAISTKTKKFVLVGVAKFSNAGGDGTVATTIGTTTGAVRIEGTIVTSP